MGKSKPDQFDAERGDVLVIPRQRCIELRELKEDAAKILLPFVAYVAGDPGDPLPEVIEDDPRLKRVFSVILHQLIENQKQRAAIFAAKSETQRQNANQRWHKGDANQCDGIPPHTTECKYKGKGKGKKEMEGENPVGIDFLPSITSDKSEHADGTSAPAAGGHCVTAAPDGTRTATRVAYVEPLTGEQIIERTFNEAELRARPVSFMLEAIGETGDQRTRNALKKAVEDLGPDRFADTCWRFVADMVQAENDCAAAIARAREGLTKRHGDKAEAVFVETLREIESGGSTNPANDCFVIPWQKWRDFTPGRFLMAALNEARLAAGIPTKRKPGKGKGGEA